MGLRSWPDPASGVDIFRPEHGENVADDLPIMSQNYARRRWAHAQRLRNYEYDQGTLRRRKPFTAKSTINFNASADFGSGAETPGVFQGGYDYVDGTDTARLLHGHNNGTIKEWTAAGTSVNRVTGLTTGRKIRFEDFNGAIFAVNGADQPRRGDATTWRLAGPPSALAAPTAGANGAGSIEAGQYIYMVTACIRESGVVILESDHSGYLTLTYAGASQQVINWVASGDSRVNWYRLYRSKKGLGLPFFLHTEGNVTTATDNSADASLSATEAAPLARNGTMPIAAIVARSGQRLALANLSTDSKGVALSIIAADNYQMEYIPTDGIHRFRLPGKGAVTACFPIGNKDEDDNANDLFLAQAESCYLLRETDPYGKLETISAQRGCIGPDAVCQWGRYLFFVSREGLEFLGPSGAPVMVSRFVNAYFKGGGPQSLNGLQGDQYVHLRVWQNRLLITFRDDTSKTWGNKTLVLDLELFNAFEPLNPKSTRFTHWTGPGMAFYVVGSSGALYLFDNQNHRILQRAASGAHDVIAGTNTTIRCEPWTGAMVGELLTYRKRFCSVNMFQVSDVDTQWTFEIDYNLIDDTPRTIPQNATTRDWDKEWDKEWESAPRYKGCLGLKRRACGAFIVAKGVIDNSGTDHILLGWNLNYTMVKQRTVCKRQ
jgi:hypothetical protein